MHTECIIYLPHLSAEMTDVCTLPCAWTSTTAPPVRNILSTMLSEHNGAVEFCLPLRLYPAAA